MHSTRSVWGFREHDHRRAACGEHGQRFLSPPTSLKHRTSKLLLPALSTAKLSETSPHGCIKNSHDVALGNALKKRLAFGVRPSVRLSARQSICPSGNPFVCPSVHPFVRSSVRLSVFDRHILRTASESKLNINFLFCPYSCRLQSQPQP